MEIAINDLSFAYSDRQVLSHCSLRIASGEVLALLGPSGCGKSTLLKLLQGLLTQEQGEILFDGAPAVDGREISTHLSESRLFPWMTLEENLSLVGKRTQAREYLEALDMSRWADYYPSALSVGMTQKILLARLALVPARLWLLDEPFNGLDLSSKALAQSFLRQHKGDRTVILVTHNLQEATTFADRVLLWNRETCRPEREWTPHTGDETSLREMLLETLGSEEGIAC